MRSSGFNAMKTIEREGGLAIAHHGTERMVQQYSAWPSNPTEGTIKENN